MWIIAAIAVGCVACSTVPPGAGHGDPNALWKIVHDQCVPDQKQAHDPAPCAAVFMEGNPGGYAILKDRDGASQFLLIPTERISGIEDARLIREPGFGFFQDAWAARHFVFERLGKALPRDDVGLAVNSPVGRTQNQLHIHIDCVRADVRDALLRAEGKIGFDRPSPVHLVGRDYSAMKIASADLSGIDPFELVAKAAGANAMKKATAALVGATFASGESGFYLLYLEAKPAAGEFASSEELLDHDCALAR
jgi:CDP-diacylglycerol pyrophosphatase